MCNLPGGVVPWTDTGRGRRCQRCVAAVGELPVECEEFLAAVTGVTYRQLDFWTKRGWLRANNPNCGSGRTRMWPVSEIQVAKVMAVLTDPGPEGAGMSPEKAAVAARNSGLVGQGIRVVVDRPDVQLGVLGGAG